MIHSVITERSYPATCLRDCKTFIDQQAYEKAIRKRDLVLLGEVCAEPYDENGQPCWKIER
ncbi:MAG: hypothetical protein ACO3L1_07010 [Flavobacteriaceae bacterium]|jgi:hypothetical protein